MDAVDHRRQASADAEGVARVVWSRRALADLNATFAYLDETSPAVAIATFLKLRRAADSLDRMPNRGRPIAEGRRELTHVHPYLIRYRVKGGVVEILEVRHGAQEPD